jgi:hypothetical protein
MTVWWTMPPSPTITHPASSTILMTRSAFTHTRPFEG